MYIMDKVSVVSIQNKRQYMEDTYSIKKLKNNQFLCAVFDGHGGDAVSKLCRDAFADILYQSMLTCANDMSVSIHNAFKSADCLAKNIDTPHEGSTACICVITSDKIWFANAGDSMALASIHGKPYMMSYEHKVENEKERIISEGGMITYYDGVARVNGTLNVARAIGDHYLKRHISSAPYVRSVRKAGIDYIVLASDGLWDAVNEYDVDTVVKQAKSTDFENYPKIAAENLNTLAISRGSSDNITIIVIPYETIANHGGPMRAQRM